MRALARAHTHTHTHMYVHTHIHTRVRMHARTHTHCVFSFLFGKGEKCIHEHSVLQERTLSITHTPHAPQVFHTPPLLFYSCSSHVYSCSFAPLSDEKWLSSVPPQKTRTEDNWVYTVQRDWRGLAAPYAAGKSKERDCFGCFLLCRGIASPKIHRLQI